jgi:hypothetical protein
VTELELQNWLLVEGLKDDLDLLAQITAASEIANLSSNVENIGLSETLDWESLLFAGSILARSEKRPHLEAALRIATAALTLETRVIIKDAAAVLLGKLSNYRSADLAVKRGLIEPGLNARLGVSARVEATARELNNSILIGKSGEWLQVNRFQQDFWAKANKPQSWVSASAPTASGKTYLVLQWLLNELLTTSTLLAIYLAPTRALVSEIEDNLNTLILAEKIGNISVTALPTGSKYRDARR